MIKEAINRLVNREDLSADEAKAVFEEIMTGAATGSQIAGLLVALRIKGETVQEITGAAKVMREHAIKVGSRHKQILDLCGTGGDASCTFNISTTAAFVVAGAGIPVAKHGNRAVSSKCGSADLLEALGVKIELPLARLSECLNEIGMCFLFAPALHPAMKFAMPARRELGIRTIFNVLGPLTNPAGATHQLVGVYDEGLTEKVATVLAGLGTSHAMVIHSEDGLDEVSISGRTKVSELKAGKVRTYNISPEEFGIEKSKLSEIAGADIKFNAKLTEDVLSGKSGPHRDVAVFNAGCAIYTADRADDIKQGISIAARSIDEKAALRKLYLLREYTNR